MKDEAQHVELEAKVAAMSEAFDAAGLTLRELIAWVQTVDGQPIDLEGERHHLPRAMAEKQLSAKSSEADEGVRELVRFLSAYGFHQKRIAALLDMNQGRIAEIVQVDGMARTNLRLAWVRI